MSNQGKTRALESFLNPSILRSNLIVVALYITAFELLKDSIVKRIREFYARPHDTTSNPVPGPDYEKEVLQGRKKVLPASLAWLKESDAIDDTDIGNFKKAKERRDKLTHEMAHCGTGFPQTYRPDSWTWSPYWIRSNNGGRSMWTSCAPEMLT